MSSFTSSLRHGSLGEALFFQAHEGELKKESGRASDFSVVATGEHVELKSDMWDMNKTPNFFFERWGDRDAKKPGGPWQALANGANHFVYFYVPSLTYFSFDTRKLVGALEAIIPSMKPTEVVNKNWITEGYRVPREKLKALYVEVKLRVSREAIP